MKTAQSFPAPLSIKRGNSHRLYVRNGSTLVCHTGQLDLTGPLACGYESFHPLHIVLRAGEAYVADCRGWVYCLALTDAAATCIAPPEPRWLAHARDTITAVELKLKKWVARSDSGNGHMAR